MRVYFSSTVVTPEATAEGLEDLPGDACLPCVVARARRGKLGRQVTVSRLIEVLGAGVVTGLSAEELSASRSVQES
jgi:hypothetical protein